MSSINEKSYIIENLKITNFYHKTSDIENYLLTNYINIIINETYIYGVSKVPYESNLNYTKKKIYKRLTESRDENNSEEEKRTIMESIDVKEILNQLYNIAYNNYNLINKLDAFDNFVKTINVYQNNSDIEVKNIREMIHLSRYNNEIKSFLNNKLNTLKNKIYNYYYNINYRLLLLNSNLSDNMLIIKSYLDSCNSNTRYVLNSEYEKIYSESKLIHEKKYLNNIEIFDKEPYYNLSSEHMKNYAKASLYNINEYADFKLNVYLEGTDFKKPRVKGSIIYKSIPEKIEIDIYHECGICCKEGHKYYIYLNDINYTMTVEYDTISSNINLNTYTNIEKYNFTEIVYKEEIKEILINVAFDDSIKFNYPSCSKAINNFTIYDKIFNEKAKINFNNSNTILK